MLHANLLKQYIARSKDQVTQEPVETNNIASLLECACVSILECEDSLSESGLGMEHVMTDNEDIIALPPIKPKETVADVKISTSLDPEQTNQVKRTLGSHRDVVTDLPGETNLGQHEIKLTT